MATLLLYISGPMQSWGYRSRFGDRDTASEPTRSGIIGLLCAALGIGRDGDLLPFSALSLGIRIDAAGRIMDDFHTAQNVMRASRERQQTVLSQRAYLADARFLVGIEHVDSVLLRAWESALLHPRWPLYLGRRSYPIAGPIVFPGGSIIPGIGVDKALRSIPFLRLDSDLESAVPEYVTLLLEEEDGLMQELRADMPLDYAERRYSMRAVRYERVATTTLPGREIWPCSLPN